MSKTLTEIAQQLSTAQVTRKTVTEEKRIAPKVQLVYAFNGVGKTRLSREFKKLISPKSVTNEGEGAEVEAEPQAGEPEFSLNKVLYYNAFTEDLFYWDNDLELDADPKLKIQPNAFTDWILRDQGQDQNIITNFQRYSNDKLTPHFSVDFTEVTFSIESGDDVQSGNLKISKGEESNFIWNIFYTLIQQIIDTLNDIDPDYPEPTPFDSLEYVFIDDPVSSLDDNHLIQLAVDLAQLIKSSKSAVKFVITTHNPLFYNVLHNEFKKDVAKYRLESNEDGTHQLVPQHNDSPFSYHLHLIAELEKAISEGQIQKYHFNLLRNIAEKTSTFLGYETWGELLPPMEDGRPNSYATRIINISSHSKHAGEEVAALDEADKRVLDYVIKHIKNTYLFKQKAA